MECLDCKTHLETIFKTREENLILYNSLVNEKIISSRYHLFKTDHSYLKQKNINLMNEQESEQHKSNNEIAELNIKIVELNSTMVELYNLIAIFEVKSVTVTNKHMQKNKRIQDDNKKYIKKIDELDDSIIIENARADSMYEKYVCEKEIAVDLLEKLSTETERADTACAELLDIEETINDTITFTVEANKDIKHEHVILKEICNKLLKTRSSKTIVLNEDDWNILSKICIN
jgi:hypothetical protein